MRNKSHGQDKEPLLERFLRDLRFRQATKYIKKESIVADLGCGYEGELLKNISNIINRGIGYDVSITKKGLPKNITLKRANFSKKFNSPKNYFDSAVGLAVLEHVEDPADFLRQIRTMLKTKGIIIITTPHKKSKRILEFLSSGLGLISKQEISDHKNYFDEFSLRKILIKNGFKVIEASTFEFGLNLFYVAQKV